jgi:phenylalanyl-tRNA synthetase beta chain
MVMKKTKIRDVESNGMLVSFAEMGLSDDATGIIDLPSDTKIGTSLSSIFGLDDPIIDINVTPNRADCAGIRGIARDLAAKGLGTLKPLKTPVIKGQFPSPITVTITDKTCHHFVGRVIKGVTNKSSPQWLQNRLKAIGLRPISALVDITNYISFDLCRPSHVFDADKLKGNIIVRAANTKEAFKALNDKDYELDNGVCVIADQIDAHAIAGIMGGLHSACSDTTQNIFLELAYFEPYNIAKSGRNLAINSDARYRFERGIDPLFTREAIEIATHMILDICGGEPSEIVEAGAPAHLPLPVLYKPELVKKILGYEIETSLQEKYLLALDCKIEKRGGTEWIVMPPSFRHDLKIPHDFVEEIARLSGFDSIPSVPVKREQTIVQSAETGRGTKIRLARNLLAARGFNETVTWSFMDKHHAEAFAPSIEKMASLTISNPISNDLNQMRPSILPNLIMAATRNHARGIDPTPLFEIGPVFWGTNTDEQPTMVTALRAGNQHHKHWAEATSARPVDLFDLKADMLAVLGSSFANAPITREAPAYYHPGRSGAVRLGNKLIAYFGEIHPRILDALDINITPIIGFEINLDSLPDAKKKSNTKPVLELSAFQPVTRDFAFIAPHSLESEQIIKTIRAIDRTLITKAYVFDIYTGKGVEDGHKSIAVSVTLQPTTHSLTDSEIEGIGQKIIDGVKAKTGAILR